MSKVVIVAVSKSVLPAALKLSLSIEPIRLDLNWSNPPFLNFTGHAGVKNKLNFFPIEPACEKGPWAKVQHNMCWNDNQSEVSSEKNSVCQSCP